MSADQGIDIHKNNGDLQSSSPEPTAEKEQVTDSRQRGEDEEKMEIAAEGDQELKVLPESAEEQNKEEAILATTEKPTTKMSSSRTPTKRGSKSNPTQRHHQRQKTKVQEDNKTIPLTSLSKQLDKQITQINKIMQLLQPIQKQIKSAERQLELTKQAQSQIKQLQKQLSQIQKKMI